MAENSNGPWFIRGGQPDECDIDDLIYEYNIKTIVNLRGNSEEEFIWSQKRGIRMIPLDVSGRVGPTDQQIKQFFQIILESGLHPIFIHCHGGIHRTGIMVAYYRIQFEDWTNEEAIEELEDNYFNWTTADRSIAVQRIREFIPFHDIAR